MYKFNHIYKDTKILMVKQIQERAQVLPPAHGPASNDARVKHKPHHDYKIIKVDKRIEVIYENFVHNL